jgi:MscS family membrane protein
MRSTRLKRTIGAVLVLGCLMATPSVLFADDVAKSVRPRTEFLSSPREALKTLYYAAVAYDMQPQLMDEAVACLDLDPARAADQAEAVRLAIELEQTLRILCIPIHGVPENTHVMEAVANFQLGSVTVCDADGFKIVLARGSDGLWRFDRDTTERIPAMNRAALARFRSMQAERAGLKDEYTDPSATMRRFLIDMMARDWYSAARCLDLSGLEQEERGDKGPLLARQLAFVVQRRGWVFMQEVPNQPSGPAFTWHADRNGRIALERVRLDDGKEAWLFNKKTVRNIQNMYDHAKDLPPDPRFVRLGIDLPPLKGDEGVGKGRPASVPAYLGSPRAMLEGFFRVMSAAETKDARLLDALEYLDLQGIPQADRHDRGVKIADKLEAVLQRIRIDRSALPDDWNAPTQVLGDGQGVRIEIVRQRDGCWRFSRATVGQASAFLDQLTSHDRTEYDRTADLDCPRDTMKTFLTAMHQGNQEQAAICLDLSGFRSGTQEEVGPILAWKLKYVMDRIGRVYIEEVPDTPNSPPYIFYRGELGRIVISRVGGDGPRKGKWLFSQETVRLIEPMFRDLLDKPPSEAVGEVALRPPPFRQAPGVWVRLRVPASLRPFCWRLQLYQWLGLALAVVVSAVGSRLLLSQVYRFVALVLRKSGSVLTKPFIAAKLRPLTWVVTWWVIFETLCLLDLPVRLVNVLLPFRTLGMAGLIGWLGVQVVDLATGIYMNSELLRPHRNLSDMVVPVSMRSLKAVIVLVVVVYVVYQFGEGETLKSFLTGLGVAGLAASLAAQDALKSFFSTLLLIGERSFRIGDRIAVGGVEGVVEQVGFRATRLRTADGSLLTIPNSSIASAPIDNLSTKTFVRLKATLLVNYDTAPEHIIALRDRLRQWLLAHPKVRSDHAEVGVNRLTGQGVEVTVDLQLVHVSTDDELALKEEINCEVLRLCRDLAGREAGAQHPLANDAEAWAA